MTTFADRLRTANDHAACMGLCQTLFIRMVEATTIDWTECQVWVVDNDDVRRGIGQSRKALADSDVVRYFHMLSDLSEYISIIQATDHQQATSPSAASLCPRRTGVTLSGQEVSILTHQNHDMNYHLQKLLDDWIAILRRAVQVPRSFDDSLRPAHVRHFWAAEWKRRRPESPLGPSIPPRGSDDDICFEHMKIVLHRALEYYKPLPELLSISTAARSSSSQVVDEAFLGLHSQQSGSLLPPRPPSPHSIRSMRTVTSIVSDIRSFAAKSFDNLLVSTTQPHDPRETPLWSIPHQPLCSQHTSTAESAFFPHVPVHLPPDSSPRWDARRRALERLNQSVRFSVKDVARYTMVPPSPGKGWNWRWEEVENDPWNNRRQHRQSSLSSGLDGVWKLSQRWRQWRKGPAVAQDPIGLEDPFQSIAPPPSLPTQTPFLNVNKPLPPTPSPARTKFARRLSAIRAWRPRRSRAITYESPSTSASSSLVSLTWTDEDNTAYEQQQRVEDEGVLGMLLVRDWNAVGVSPVPRCRNSSSSRKGKLMDSGLYMSPLRAMESS
ncbi:hypothetical protein FRC04_000895 [Tulasnella sp. 424]|nr:hypothetical protein FRC04_000895 [Tulasnella sp. 424]KAG8975370.1 hypothetical protein FRC05_005700 [Tulasnella sp. 425]